MRWPIVSREAYDERGRTLADAQAQRDRLLDLVATMRQDGFSKGKPAKITSAPDPEEVGLARAEAQLIERASDLEFVNNMADDIVRKTGVSRAEAVKEARRMRQTMSMEDPIL